MDTPENNMQSNPISLEELKEYRIELTQQMLMLVQFENEAIARHAGDPSVLSKELRQILDWVASVSEEQERVDKLIGESFKTEDRLTGRDSHGLDRPGQSGISNGTYSE